MPMKLNVGVSRKLGLPGYSSAGASCNVELELDSGLLQSDLAAFHVQVRGAFAAARQAVDEELNRLQALPVPLAAVTGPTNGHAHRNGNGSAPHAIGLPTRAGPPREPSRKSATPSQVNALYAIARSRCIDLEELLQAEWGVDRPENLSVREASEFIDRLKGVTAG